MKKGIIVLLIAVLVAGFAFADGKAGDVTFTGKAKIGYEYWLDDNDNGIINSSETKFSFKFQFATADGASKGEGKLYAEIEATADAYLEWDKAGNGAGADAVVDIDITKANIVGLNGDLVIDILGPEGAYDYAKSYVTHKVDGKKIPLFDFANSYETDGNGFVVSFKDFSLAFEYYSWDSFDTSKIYAGLQTPAFKLADGMTIQAAANFVKLDLLGFIEGIEAGGGVEFKYAPEESKMSATFDADAGVIKIKDVDEIGLPIDVSAKFKYDFVTLDVYCGTEDKFEEDTMALAAKVSVNYKVNDSITVTAYGEGIMDKTGRYAVAYEKPIIDFGAKLSYSADKFAAYAGVDATLLDSADGYVLKAWEDLNGTKRPGLGITAGVSTKALIDNCTVALDYDKSDFSKDGDEVKSKGRITASATVAF